LDDTYKIIKRYLLENLPDKYRPDDVNHLHSVYYTEETFIYKYTYFSWDTKYVILFFWLIPLALFFGFHKDLYNEIECRIKRHVKTYRYSEEYCDKLCDGTWEFDAITINGEPYNNHKASEYILAAKKLVQELQNQHNIRLANERSSLALAKRELLGITSETGQLSIVDSKEL
jgi:hypothetical protein